VALISNNRVEWAVAKFALASLGAPLVPMYEAQLDKDWKYIIEDSGAKMVIAGTEAVYNRIKHYPSNVGCTLLSSSFQTSCLISTSIFDIQVGNVVATLCFDLAADQEHSYKR
jgi:long-subunit acyl-CoA synthetase (AMP-forming)